jgi:DNA-binding NarL/FixJ family response regulator
MRDGIMLILGMDPHVTVVAEASTGEEAVARFLEQRPDVTLMDLQLRGMNGLQAIQTIRQADPQARIIVLTMYAGDANICHALQAGAMAYLLKDSVAVHGTNRLLRSTCPSEPTIRSKA